MTTLQRLLRRTIVDPATGCWWWTGAKTGRGYANARVDGRYVGVHRAVFEFVEGPIPLGANLDHLCRNTLCVNPGHLDPVPQAVNCRRGAKTKLSAADVAVIRGSFETAATLAPCFGVGVACISKIRLGKRWKEIGVHA